MKISAIISLLEAMAPPSLQESYDNAGLITGSPGWECTGAIVSLDATEEVVMEALAAKCNLIISHHPIIFRGLKKINGKNYVERAVIVAIKNDIALYAIHTNLDNVLHGVNARMAEALGLVNTQILEPRRDTLKKLVTFVPPADLERVRKALFEAGAGIMGQYSEVSFVSEGTGSYLPSPEANPYIGLPGRRQSEVENKLEIIFPAYLENSIVEALLLHHPYEEVAYDLVGIHNENAGIGSGLLADLPAPMEEKDFLEKIRQSFGLSVIRHTSLLERPVRRVALCGGAGSFLISKALASGVDFFITADLKYHEFFDAEGKMVLADIGHFESEQFTIDLLHAVLQEKFPTFAVLKTRVRTNPVHYFR